RRRALPSREHAGADRHARRPAALPRDAAVGRARDHLHGTRPAGRPLERRHEGGDREHRRRDPGAAVPQRGNQGEGLHAHGGLPRPRERRTVTARTTGRRRALTSLFSADVRGDAIATALEAEAQRAANEPERAASWLYAREIVDGVLDHFAEINELI